MKQTKSIMLILFAALLFAGCTADGLNPTPFVRDVFDGGDQGDFEHTESWEFMPFHGELRFDLLDADTQTPIPNAVIEVENLPVEESDVLTADANGRITIHQLERGIMYVGEGPPPPTFRFTAPNYEPRHFTVDELAALSGYDPYSDDGLPITEFIYEFGDSDELAIYEFTVSLTCAQADCTPATPIAQATATPNPTVTPAETATTTPTPTAAPVIIDLPAWLADPTSPVLVSTVRQNGNIFLFFDADSRERFTLPIPFESSNFSFEWTDASHFSFWQNTTVNDLPYVVRYTLNTATGEMSLYEGGFLIDNRGLSPDGRFIVRLEWTAWWHVEEGEPYGTESITIETVDGTIIELEDPFAGEYDTGSPRAEWSADGNFLSITHFHTADFEDPYAVENATTIFDNQGNLLAVLEGIRGRWAAGGSGYYQYQDWQQGGLFCVVQITSSETECYDPDWREAANSSTFSYQLSPNGSQLSFAYWRGSSNLLYDGFDGGLCLMTLETGEVACPTDEYAEFLLNDYGMSVLEANWSPDGRFLYLLLDPGGPESDDRTQSSVAFIDADGSRFSWLGDIYWSDDPAWRPLEP